MTKLQAIHALDALGHKGTAKALRAWRSVVNDNKGWDKWLCTQHRPLAKLIGMKEAQ